MQRGSFSILFSALVLTIATSAAASEFSLYDAARTGDVERVRQLIADGAEVNLRDPLDAPLHAAAAAGQLEAARLLLDAGADIELIGLLGTPLHHAVAGGRLAAVELLISYDADIDALDAYGSTALHIAAEQGNEEIARALLAAGADVNAAHARAQSSPLVDAIHAREPALVRLLIAAGADGNAIDMNCGQSALHIAVDAGDHALVRYLLDAGADPNVVEDLGETPLTLAEARGDVILVEMLRAAGAREVAELELRCLFQDANGRGSYCRVVQHEEVH